MYYKPSANTPTVIQLLLSSTPIRTGVIGRYLDETQRFVVGGDWGGDKNAHGSEHWMSSCRLRREDLNDNLQPCSPTVWSAASKSKREVGGVKVHVVLFYHSTSSQV